MCGVGCFELTLKELFTEFANLLPKLDPNSPAHAADLRYRQCITPVLMLAATSIGLHENVATMLGDRTLADMKTLTPGEAYYESTSTAFPHSVEKRQRQVILVYHAAARSLDAEHDSQSGSPGPVESELNT